MERFEKENPVDESITGMQIWQKSERWYSND